MMTTCYFMFYGYTKALRLLVEHIKDSIQRPSKSQFPIT